jgi:hypothetical protein
VSDPTPTPSPLPETVAAPAEPAFPGSILAALATNAAPTTEPSPESEIPAPPAAPEAESVSVAQLLAALPAMIASAVAAQLPAPPATPSTPAAKPDKPAFAAGIPVSHSYDGPEGEIRRYGVVLDALHDEGVPDRNIVAWFAGVSGPLLAGELDQA